MPALLPSLACLLALAVDCFDPRPAVAELPDASRAIRLDLFELDGTRLEEPAWARFQSLAEDPEERRLGLASAYLRPDGRGGLAGEVPTGIDPAMPYRLWIGAPGERAKSVRDGLRLTAEPWLARVAELVVPALEGPAERAGPRDLGQLRFRLPEPTVDLWLEAAGPRPALGSLAQVVVFPPPPPGIVNGVAPSALHEGLLHLPARLRLYGEAPVVYQGQLRGEWWIDVQIPGDSRIRSNLVLHRARSFARLEQMHDLVLRPSPERVALGGTVVLLTVVPLSEPWPDYVLGPAILEQTLPWREHLVRRWHLEGRGGPWRLTGLLEGEYVLEVWPKHSVGSGPPDRRDRIHLSESLDLEL